MAKGTILGDRTSAGSLLVVQTTHDRFWGRLSILGLFCGLRPDSRLFWVCDTSTALLGLRLILQLF